MATVHLLSCFSDPALAFALSWPLLLCLSSELVMSFSLHWELEGRAGVTCLSACYPPRSRQRVGTLCLWAKSHQREVDQPSVEEVLVHWQALKSLKMKMEMGPG